MYLASTIDLLQETFGISEAMIRFTNTKEEEILPHIQRHRLIRTHNQLKVLKAFHDHRLSTSDFYSPTGYGYGDLGREKADEVFASVFGTEDALVRPSIASGTHALTLCLQGLLLPGDEMLCITGTPYDTMQKIIGLKGEIPHSLLEYGIPYRQTELVDGAPDPTTVLSSIHPKTKLVYLQRSTGYSDRAAISIAQIEAIVEAIRAHHPDIIMMVDNCYGEFTEIKEPTEVGVDLIAGSLIKNPGGGIAKSGGYIAGKADLIERISYRLTAPGLGRDVGLTYGTTREVLQGLYFAPQVTHEAICTALLFSAVYCSLGYTVIPKPEDTRSDIVQTIQLDSPEAVCRFCEATQEAGTMDAHVTPIPGDMPGYSDQIIMASGGFVDGSSIEVSADGPLRPPYRVFYQGGLTFDQGKLAVLSTLSKLLRNGIIAPLEDGGYTRVIESNLPDLNKNA